MTSVKEILNREQYHLKNAKKVSLYGILERVIYFLNENHEPEIDSFIMKDNGSMVFRFEYGEWDITKHSIEENYSKHTLLAEIAELLKETELSIEYNVILSHGEVCFEMDNGMCNFQPMELTDIIDRLVS